MCIAKANPISLCSHSNFCQKLNHPVSATPTHMLRICVNSPTIAGRRGADPYNIKSKYSQNKKCAFHPVRARTKFTPAYPVSATPTAFASRIGQFPPLYAGVQTMRARICSAISCDIFARVVCLRLRRAAKLPTFTFISCRTHLPRMARATNSCTR